MGYKDPKGHSVIDYDAAYLIKLPGTFTFATLPTGGNLKAGLTAYCSDLNSGGGGTALYNGTSWAPFLSSTSGGLTPGGLPNVLFQWGVPVIAPSSCTMGANGAFTAMTAVPAGFVGNCWLILPAGYVTAAQLAGVFAATLSSTTAGTIFNNTLASGAPTLANFPASLTPFVATAGTGTQISTIQAAITLTIPANSFGADGAMEFRLRCFFTNNADVKTVTATLGASTFIGAALASDAVAQVIRTIQNVGATNRQICFNALPSNDIGGGANALNSFSLDTTTALTLVISMTLATVTDYGGFYGGSVLSYFAP